MRNTLNIKIRAYFKVRESYKHEDDARVCDPPRTVTVALTVRTREVKTEQVYSPSSDSRTSPIMDGQLGARRAVQLDAGVSES